MCSSDLVVFLPEFHGQGSRAGYSPRCRQESDKTERLTSTLPGVDTLAPPPSGHAASGPVSGFLTCSVGQGYDSELAHVEGRLHGGPVRGRVGRRDNNITSPRSPAVPWPKPAVMAYSEACP